MSPRILILAAVLLACGPLGAADAHRPSLSDSQGKTVAVWAPLRIQGTLTAFDADAVRVRLGTGETRVVPRSSIRQMRLRSNVATTYLAAGLAGAAVGAAVGLGVARSRRTEACFASVAPVEPRHPAAGCWSGGGYAAGAAAGAALGALTTLVTTSWLHGGWHRIDVGHAVEAGIVPVRGGLGVAARITF